MEAIEEARQLGWTPREAFKGDPEKWVDAEEFLERGRHVMPMLKENNRKLVAQIERLQGEVSTLSTAVTESREAIAAYKQFQETATAAQVAKARKDLLEELKAAKEGEDVEAEVNATSRLSAFDAAQAAKPAPKAPPGTPAATAAPIDPEVKVWMGENPWYGEDQLRTGVFTGMANKLRKEGVEIKGRAFLKAVADAVEEQFGSGSEPAQRSSKAEGSGGGTGNSGGSGSQDYASLPSDARQACDKGAEKFVGENKIFKTKKEWQAHYAQQYYKGN